MKIHNLTGILIALAVTCTIVGCKGGQMVEIGAQTHFNYPNSNVRPLGPVRLEMDGPSAFGMPALRTGEMDQKLYNEALAQVEGANIIIDYVRTTTFYHAPIIPIWWSKMTLEGTAAKMELGKQILY